MLSYGNLTSSEEVFPSKRRYLKPRIKKNCSRKSMSSTICENSKTRCPAAFSFGNMRSSSSNFPEQRIILSSIT